ncbi:hypothetical protein C8F01DRAFT_55073 [Mycena amicta]|nr:hypothetical protein C8F01DRAFT_55073 [Mycena amicta]
MEYCVDRLLCSKHRLMIKVDCCVFHRFSLQTRLALADTIGCCSFALAVCALRLRPMAFVASCGCLPSSNLRCKITVVRHARMHQFRSNVTAGDILRDIVHSACPDACCSSSIVNAFRSNPTAGVSFGISPTRHAQMHAARLHSPSASRQPAHCGSYTSSPSLFYTSRQSPSSTFSYTELDWRCTWRTVELVTFGATNGVEMSFSMWMRASKPQCDRTVTARRRRDFSLPHPSSSSALYVASLPPSHLNTCRRVVPPRFPLCDE